MDVSTTVTTTRAGSPVSASCSLQADRMRPQAMASSVRKLESITVNPRKNVRHRALTESQEGIQRSAAADRLRCIV